jgi:hypothetical protein
VIFTQPLDRLGFHLATAVIDEFGPLVLRQVQDVLIYQASFQQEPGLLGGLLPTDAPLDGFAGPFIQQQVERDDLSSLNFLLINSGIAIPKPSIIENIFEITWPAFSHWLTVAPDLNANDFKASSIAT